MQSTSAKISIAVGVLIVVAIVVLGWMFPDDSDEKGQPVDSKKETEAE